MHRPRKCDLRLCALIPHTLPLGLLRHRMASASAGARRATQRCAVLPMPQGKRAIDSQALTRTTHLTTQFEIRTLAVPPTLGRTILSSFLPIASRMPSVLNAMPARTCKAETFSLDQFSSVERPASSAPCATSVRRTCHTSSEDQGPPCGDTLHMPRGAPLKRRFRSSTNIGASMLAVSTSMTTTVSPSVPSCTRPPPGSVPSMTIPVLRAKAGACERGGCAAWPEATIPCCGLDVLTIMGLTGLGCRDSGTQGRGRRADWCAVTRVARVGGRHALLPPCGVQARDVVRQGRLQAAVLSSRPMQGQRACSHTGKHACTKRLRLTDFIKVIFLLSRMGTFASDCAARARGRQGPAPHGTGRGDAGNARGAMPGRASASARERAFPHRCKRDVVCLVSVPSLHDRPGERAGHCVVVCSVCKGVSADAAFRAVCTYGRVDGRVAHGPPCCGRLVVLGASPAAVAPPSAPPTVQTADRTHFNDSLSSAPLLRSCLAAIPAHLASPCPPRTLLRVRCQSSMRRRSAARGRHALAGRRVPAHRWWARPQKCQLR